MDAQQRFLRRIFLQQNLDLFLREANFHRSHHDDQNRSGMRVWHWQEEEGKTGGLF